jgi:hypothetical protein
MNYMRSTFFPIPHVRIGIRDFAGGRPLRTRGLPVSLETAVMMTCQGGMLAGRWLICKARAGAGGLAPFRPIFRAEQPEHARPQGEFRQARRTEISHDEPTNAALLRVKHHLLRNGMTTRHTSTNDVPGASLVAGHSILQERFHFSDFPSRSADAQGRGISASFGSPQRAVGDGAGLAAAAWRDSATGTIRSPAAWRRGGRISGCGGHDARSRPDGDYVAGFFGCRISTHLQRQARYDRVFRVAAPAIAASSENPGQSSRRGYPDSLCAMDMAARPPGGRRWASSPHVVRRSRSSYLHFFPGPSISAAWSRHNCAFR